MRNLEIHCPYCSMLVHVRQENLGSLLQCPSCPGKFRVPPPEVVRRPVVNQPSQPSPRLASPQLGLDLNSDPSPSRRRGYRRQRPSAQQPSPLSLVRPPIQGYSFPNDSSPASSRGHAATPTNQLAFPQHDMVMVVVGIIIGVLLALVVAMLVMLGTGQFGQNARSTPSVVVEKSTPAVENSTRETEHVVGNEPNNSPTPATNEQQGKFGFVWDARKGQIDGSIARTKTEENRTGNAAGFRNPPKDFGTFKPKTPPTAQSTAPVKLQ